jgi:hypothetical protein
VLGLKVDVRHRPDVIIDSVTELSELEDNSIGFLRTPFALQRSEDQTGEWAGGVRGLSVRVDVRALAIHVFLGRLGNDTGLTWDAFRLYNELRGAGLR